MKERGVLEKQFPGTKFDWKVLASGAAIRDGIIAGQIQIGAGGVGPFLIGWDRGVGYRLIASLNQMDLWLVTRDKDVKSLKDIRPDMKIGMPSPDAIQGIVLRLAAQEQLGNAHALDANIVAIEHPLGVQALQNGQIAAHLSSPPFQYQEVQAGGHIILHSYDVAKDATFNSAYTTEKFYHDYPKFVEAFYRDLLETTQFVRSNKKQTADLLSREAGGKVPASDFERWISHPDLVYSTTPRGFIKFGRFMQSIGMISKAPSSMREIELPTLGGVGD
jgi:NitT/TauT family transport system substrate-binding protein